MRIGKTGKVELQDTYIKMALKVLNQGRQARGGGTTSKVSFRTNKQTGKDWQEGEGNARTA